MFVDLRLYRCVYVCVCLLISFTRVYAFARVDQPPMDSRLINTQYFQWYSYVNKYLMARFLS